MTRKGRPTYRTALDPEEVLWLAGFWLLVVVQHGNPEIERVARGEGLVATRNRV